MSTASAPALPARTTRRSAAPRLIPLALALLVLVLFFVRVLLGDYTVTFPDLVRILGGEQIPGASYIVREAKLPRALAAVLVGGGLGLAGALMQDLLRNPLASPDVLGISIGASAGAVVGSIVLGLVAGMLSPYAVGLKFKFGVDDSLDVVGVHLVAGVWGTIGAGLLSTSTGLLYGHGVKQTVIQILIALISVAISGVVTAIIGYALKATMGWRITEDAESAGIDQSEHAETAYDLSPRGWRLAGALGASGVTREAPVTEGANA